MTGTVREVFEGSVERLAAAVLEASEREARFWVERVSPFDLFTRSLPCGGRQIVTGAGLVLSSVRIEATGYVLTVVTERSAP